VDVSRDSTDVPPRRHREMPVARQAPADAPWGEIPPLRQIDSLLRQVSERICEILEPRRAEQELAPLFAHVRRRSGKMLRPGLVLLAGRCFGPLTEEHIRVAAVMEMIHHATLLHDDVIDNGCKRGGVPTVNRLWGNESAVLLGDFVLSHVFQMTADLSPAASAIVARTAVRVCEGELRQTLQRRNWLLTEAQYLDIITEKSASFFSGCCRLGALLAHASQDQMEALARFGLCVGVAFQITDDLLDICGEESQTGKTCRSDMVGGRPTLAVIHLLRGIEASGRAKVCALLESPDHSRDKLTDLLVQQGSLQYARERANAYVVQATEALAPLPSGETKDALLETARFMVERHA
jgi:geranylgeranyl pyrophosphate synthase